MANRVLTTITEDTHPNYAFEAEVQRSSAGAPGGFITCTTYRKTEAFLPDLIEDQVTVAVPDLRAFLAPVIAWLDENDPRGWETDKHGEGF